MGENIKQQIIEKIKVYETVIISRHIRPDGDAKGSTLGLREILRSTYPEKRIFIASDDNSDAAAFLGDEGPQPSDEDYAGALLIVLDTGNTERISNKNISLAREIVRIDHHIDEEPYGDLSWVEPGMSSASEMITELYLAFADELVMTEKAATCLYTGIVTDSGRFRYRGTTGATMRCAAALLEFGIDTEKIFSNLYMSDKSVITTRAAVSKRIRFTENGVAWLHMTNKVRRRLGMTQEDASNLVNMMDSVKGSLIWIEFIENDDKKSTRVRLRSRFVTIEELAVRYHGGGHACASGATVYSKHEMNALLREADLLLKNYKESNEGWI